VIFGIIIAALAAFPIAKLRFRGRRFFFIFMIFPFLLGSQREALVIPSFILAHDLHIVNTYLALILPGLANIMVIFVFIQFFRGVPDALIQAGLVDGASWSQILAQVVIPLSKPVIASGAVLLFLAQWNDFFWPLLVATTPRLRVITVAISFLNPGQRVYKNLVLAGSMLAASVPIVVFLLLQRYYIAGITSGSLKG
jgi:ABC-type glycerol-3-phosphate transport system permease component